MSKQSKKIDVKSAFLPDGWSNDVRISIDSCGEITAVEAGVVQGATGYLLPGIANVHSHAHQRAMAGLAEQSSSNEDSFWTWRKTMYQFIDAMQPHHFYAIASQLYLELLSAGYTHVAEFQYLHHQPCGNAYDNVAEMSLLALSAARDVGIGITVLPVHYQFGGFNEQPVGDQQKRFYNQPDAFLKICEALVNELDSDNDNHFGVAGHSLRATNVASFSEILDSGLSSNHPVHMHIAEQIKEVEDCFAWSGATPVDYCLDNFAVGETWCLIHATHMTELETLRLASSGAVAGICATTEANLGDGFFNARQYLEAGGRMGIGSDSHISTSPIEELRWFEYGQRLKHNSRNQLSGGFKCSTGETLFGLVVAGGAQACAHNSGEIAVGKRADFIILDDSSPILAGREKNEILDSWIFSGNRNSVSDVYVGGQHVIRDGVHAQQELIEQRFRAVLHDLNSK